MRKVTLLTKNDRNVRELVSAFANEALSLELKCKLRDDSPFLLLAKEEDLRESFFQINF